MCRSNVLVALYVLAAGGCSEEDPALSVEPELACPELFAHDEERHHAIRSRLASFDEGRELVHGLAGRRASVCFGPRERGVVTDEDQLLLPQYEIDAELVARFGHLLHHVVRGRPFPTDIGQEADCSEIVERAVVREAAAYALEVRLRAQLGLAPDRYEFEESAETSEREIAAYLRSHPGGARNLDPLVAGYTERCRRMRNR